MDLITMSDSDMYRNSVQSTTSDLHLSDRSYIYSEDRNNLGIDDFTIGKLNRVIINTNIMLGGMRKKKGPKNTDVSLTSPGTVNSDTVLSATSSESPRQNKKDKETTLSPTSPGTVNRDAALSTTSDKHSSRKKKHGNKVTTLTSSEAVNITSELSATSTTANTKTIKNNKQDKQNKLMPNKVPVKNERHQATNTVPPFSSAPHSESPDKDSSSSSSLEFDFGNDQKGGRKKSANKSVAKKPANKRIAKKSSKTKNRVRVDVSEQNIYSIGGGDYLLSEPSIFTVSG